MDSLPENCHFGDYQLHNHRFLDIIELNFIHYFLSVNLNHYMNQNSFKKCLKFWYFFDIQLHIIRLFKSEGTIQSFGPLGNNRSSYIK